MENKEQPQIELAGDEEVKTRRHRWLSGHDLRATTIGWEIALPIVFGPLIGFLIDRNKGTGVRWTLILLGVGLLVAVASVVRHISYEFHLMEKENEKTKKEKEDHAKITY